MPDANHFFGIGVDSSSVAGQTLALLLAVVLGGLIGLERELHGHPAGIRTQILVCMGSTLMTLTSVAIGRGEATGEHYDPGRLAAQIVTGIGFLGAGAIIRDGGSVRGMTTAASIWATAGIGITIGVSPRLGELAVTATIVALVTLVFLNRLEEAFALKQRIRTLTFTARSNEEAMEVIRRLTERGVTLYGVAAERAEAGETTTSPPTGVTLRCRVKLPGGLRPDTLMTELSQSLKVSDCVMD